MTLTNEAKGGNTITRDAPRRAGILTECHRASGAEDKQTGQIHPSLSLFNGAEMASPKTPKTEQPADQPKRDLVLNSRADLRDLLIKAGLARAAAEKVAKGGWPALSGEITETDIAEDCADLARTLAETFKEI
ncbi:hypothetical protein [Roseovarius sp. D0-M9]|uniref:hypothetical protein n=1 Tax=Roseovarius sp. D0-M9 TaxID=3127117 RepID=UPI00301035B7